jgi:hypothetical protein
MQVDRHTMTFETSFIQKNRWSLSKVMKNLVRPSIAGNAKNMRNRLKIRDRYQN